MSKRDKTKEHYHNKGQEDAKQGRYKPAYGRGDLMTTFNDKRFDRKVDVNRSYDKGYANQRGQSDGAEGKYHNPFSASKKTEAHEAYDDGWQASRDNEKKQSGGCYVSSACLKSRNLPDDCRELRVLRMFRDHHLMTSRPGRQLVDEYYRIAPTIVDEINSRRNSLLIWEGIFVKLVEPICRLIDNGRFGEAVALYRSEVLKLKERYFGIDT